MLVMLKIILTTKGHNMNIKTYNFSKPKINRQELELLNWFLAHTNDNPLINPEALELFKANGYSAKNYQDLVNKVKTILKTYKTKGELWKPILKMTFLC